MDENRFRTEIVLYMKRMKRAEKVEKWVDTETILSKLKSSRNRYLKEFDQQRSQ